MRLGSKNGAERREKYVGRMPGDGNGRSIDGVKSDSVCIISGIGTVKKKLVLSLSL